MKNQGQGKGGIAKEDKNLKGEFQSEKEKTRIQAGKMLMDDKVKGEGKKNESSSNYDDNLKKIQEDVSEAIESEDVPAGYHEGVKKYFDKIDKEEKEDEHGDEKGDNGK